MRQCPMSLCAVCVQGGRTLARKFRVKPPCRAVPGTVRICGSSCGMGSAVHVADTRRHGQVNATWLGRGWKRCLRRRCASMIFVLVCSSNME